MTSRGLVRGVLKRTLHADFNAEREPPAQLVARVPKSLHRRIKVHCAVYNITVMEFALQAIREKLTREGGRQRKRGG